MTVKELYNVLAKGNDIQIEAGKELITFPAACDSMLFEAYGDYIVDTCYIYDANTYVIRLKCGLIKE